MPEPFVGEIRMFAGNFAPRGWAFCDGQLLAISQNDALYSVIGTLYGGDGRTTFALPDLRGRVPIHAGQGPGLSEHELGSTGGLEPNIPSRGDLPENARADRSGFSAPHETALDRSAGEAIGAESGDQSGGTEERIPVSGDNPQSTNLPPFLAVNFIIALQGIYPSRS
jgi:microcystin-dependent protein